LGLRRVVRTKARRKAGLLSQAKRLTGGIIESMALTALDNGQRSPRKLLRPVVARLARAEVLSGVAASPAVPGD
jgi:hypothetical protein